MKKIILFIALVGTTVLTSCNGSSSSGDKQIDTISYLLGMAQGQPDQIAAYLAQNGSDSTQIDQFIKGLQEGLKAADDPAQIAYFQGLMAGLQTKKMGFANIESNIFGNDSTRHLNPALYIQGLKDGVAKKTQFIIGGEKAGPEVAAQYLDSVSRILNEQALAKQYAKEKKKAEAYMAKIKKTEGIQSLGDNVYYKVLSAGTGAKVGERDTVLVKYTGTLVDGKEFDSSGEEARSLPVSGVVPGFKAALLAMPIGSKWEVYIPYQQAYGARPMGEVLPAYSNLIFTIELVGKK